MQPWKPTIACPHTNSCGTGSRDLSTYLQDYMAQTEANATASSLVS